MVSVLVSAVIILVLAVVFMKGSSVLGLGKPMSQRADKKGTTVLGQARWAAKDDVCRSNMSQVRSALEILRATNDDKCPDDIRETKMPSEFYKCPVGGEAYVYDPDTCKLSCPHAGHEKY